ncbi:hypothetical protein HanRHA438_Chr09g0391091 [Helianthus annuus]|nr:hypothetical protein HanRHA438_Chr09g0391091 [Helianthus annuus]
MLNTGPCRYRTIPNQVFWVSIPFLGIFVPVGTELIATYTALLKWSTKYIAGIHNSVLELTNFSLRQA